MNLFDKHKTILDNAIKALHERTFFAQYPEHPSPKIYGENADAEGQEKFKKSLNNKFEELRQANAERWVGSEHSPYLQEALGISYPAYEPETIVKSAQQAFDPWRKTTAQQRVGLLIEALENLKTQFFDIAYATMHTTGQGYMMAFQASGPHAADRALEAIAAGYEELNRFPESAHWDKPMGKFNIQLSKR